MRLKQACLIAIAAMALSACMTSQNTAMREANGTYTVAAGKSVVMPDTYLTLDPQCRPLKLPTATIVQQPAHGRVRATQINSAAQYGAGPMRHCHGTKAQSLAVQYSAERAYRGQDAFAVRIRYADGETKVVSYKINVR